METLATLGEFGLIDRLASIVGGAGQPGIGDDCAVVMVGGTALLATTDALVEGVHFRTDWTEPEDLGWKALACNLSDVAAMGGNPRFAMVTVGLPAETSVTWLERVYRGMSELAQLSGCPVVGGDTVQSPEGLLLNVAVIGEPPSGGAMLRSAARAGETLWVSGWPGEARAGYTLLKSGEIHGRSGAERRCLVAHRRPQPRLALGTALAGLGVACAMDLSDGLSGDLRRICERSRVGALLDEAALPVSPDLEAVVRQFGQSPIEILLAGGEEYELLFTAPPAMEPDVRAAARAAGVPVHAVGEITPDPGCVEWIRRIGAREALPALAWDHFKEEAG